jgi:acetylornithine deacetylase/succinyl-diaminopimelate desuccinylase-like protein
VTTEQDHEPLSSEVKRLEGEVGRHAHHPLLHLPIFEQLKLRNVFRVAVLYLVACWLILDPVGTRAADDHYRHAREVYATVIGFQTSVGLGQVPKMAEYLADQFRSAGFSSADVHIIPFGETASLVVRYRGDGTGGKPILLNAHMDVVTANRSDWQRDPFKLVEEDGYFFGRGTWDDKIDVTTLTETFLRLKAERFVPKRDLIIAFTGDEETAQATTSDLVKNHRDLIDAEYCLSGDVGQGVLDESTGKASYYQVSGAEKTSVTFEVSVRNPGGHSSKPRRENAIYQLADALKKVQGYQFPVMWNDWTLQGFRAQGPLVGGALGDAMSRFAQNPRDDSAARVLSDSPENVGQIRTTCVATRINGGHANNALPQLAAATVNCRIFPGVSVQEVNETLQRLVGQGVSVTAPATPIEAEASPFRAELMAAFAKAVHATHPGVPLVPHMEVGASDGAIFRANGIPTYGVQGIFVKLSQDFTHGLDERVPVPALAYGLKHWYTLLKDLGGRRE